MPVAYYNWVTTEKTSGICSLHSFTVVSQITMMLNNNSSGLLFFITLYFFYFFSSSNIVEGIT